ncbi:MAG: hypothetical protein GY804_11760 [Alphaproteobacteria bacterium]|nr:hypothetical protein [Alphaproteobacteria bacterium]
MSDKIIVVDGGTKASIVSILKDEGYEVEYKAHEKLEGCLTLDIIQKHKTSGKRKRKKWQSPYPS